MMSDIRPRSILVIGFLNVQVSKVFEHYGKNSQILLTDPDKEEFIIAFSSSEIATKALAFNGKTAKCSTLRVLHML